MDKETLFDEKVIFDLIAQLKLAKNILDRGLLHYKFRKLQKILDNSKPLLILILINEGRRIDYKNIRQNYDLLDFSTLLRELETVQFLKEIRNGQRNISRHNQDLVKGLGVGPSTHTPYSNSNNNSNSNEFYTPPSTPRQSSAAKSERQNKIIPVYERQAYKDVFVNLPIYLHRIEGLSKHYDKNGAFLVIKQSNSTVELPIPNYTNTTLVLNKFIRFKYDTRSLDPLEFTLVNSLDKILHGEIDKKDYDNIEKNKKVQILLKEEGTNGIRGILLATIGNENIVGEIPTFAIHVPTQNSSVSVKFHVPNNQPNEPRIITNTTVKRNNNNNFPGMEKLY